MRKEKILEIGQRLAEGWGGYCIGYKLTDTKCIFICKEYDEDFTTTISKEELEQRLNGTYKEPTFEELEKMAYALCK